MILYAWEKWNKALETMLDDMVSLHDWDLSKMLGNKCRWNSLVSQICNISNWENKMKMIPGKV